MSKTLNEKLPIIFFGTSEFAVPVLESLVKDGWPVSLVITQPDQPVGRKQILTPPPVKIAAKKLGLKILQPKRLISDFSPPAGGLISDLFVVCAYGQFIPTDLLALPKHGAINIHPSLLPKYRGPSPIQFSLLNGDQETGVSLILLDEEMDHGPILAQKKIAIGPDETCPELMSRLAKIGAGLLLKTLPKYLSGQIKPQPQNHRQATFTKILTREDGRIDWSRPARQIYNQWRASQPWPGTFTELRIKNQELRIKILKMRLSNQSALGDKKGLGMVCGDGKILAIDQLQPEGKKTMTAEEFINGYI